MKIEKNELQHQQYFSSLVGEQKKSALVFVQAILGYMNLDNDDSRNTLRQLAQNWVNIPAWTPLIESIISYVNDPKEDKSKTISQQISIILKDLEDIS
ncbi:MAG: hypothetical protein K1000chlam3_01453 [Chlamydiae bacterium]|nr:hypothetical protein [Chlamydiota bacterium]